MYYSSEAWIVETGPRPPECGFAEVHTVMGCLPEGRQLHLLKAAAGPQWL